LHGGVQGFFWLASCRQRLARLRHRHRIGLLEDIADALVRRLPGRDFSGKAAKARTAARRLATSPKRCGRSASTASTSCAL